MGREPVTETIGELEVTSTPLPFNIAQPLLPEVAELIGLAGRELGAAMAGGTKMNEDIVKLAPVLGAIASFFKDGRLERLTPKLLASTTVVVRLPNGDREVRELLKEKDRNEVFNEHPEAYLPILFFAGKVTFARFFPASVLAGGATRAQSS